RRAWCRRGSRPWSPRRNAEAKSAHNRVEVVDLAAPVWLRGLTEPVGQFDARHRVPLPLASQIGTGIGTPTRALCRHPVRRHAPTSDGIAPRSLGFERFSVSLGIAARYVRRSL